MSLVNIDNIENLEAATPELFNSRFAALVAVLNGHVDADNLEDGAVTAAKLSTEVFQKIYPIGSVYVNATDNTNPATLLGFGTWTAFATGRVMVGFDGADSDFNAAEKTGGQKDVMAHTHLAPTTPGGGTGGSYEVPNVAYNSYDYGLAAPTSSTGTGANNMNPYVVVYMWKRTA